MDINLWLLRNSTVSLLFLLFSVTNEESAMIQSSTEKDSRLTRNVVMLRLESCPDRVKLAP